MNDFSENAMKTEPAKKFHVQLPAPTYTRLLVEAARQKRPVTQLLKQAVESWLAEQERRALHEEIAAYAAECAGTIADLDEDLVRASGELLSQGERG